MNKLKRRKRIITILLAISMAFTMNTALYAGEINTDEDSIEASVDSAMEIPETETEFEDENIYGEIDEKETYVDKESGWVCTTSDNTIATNSFKKESEFTYLAVISPNHTKYIDDEVEIVNRNGEKEKIKNDYYEGYDVDLRYEGTLASGDLVLSATEKRVIRSGNNNSITISISAGDLGTSKDGDNKVCIYTRWKEGEGSYTGIGYYCVHFELQDGLVVKYVYSGTSGHWEVFMEYDDNKPTDPAEVKVDNYIITYNTKIPYFGKNQKNAINACGEITVKDTSTGQVFKAEKIKVVKLKNAPGNQGPFPTVSNAGIQIVKLYAMDTASKNAAKKITKTIKKATKVKSKQSASEIKLPVIMYPLRLKNEKIKDSVGGAFIDEFVVKGSEKNGKNKYKLEFKIGGKKISITNGKKDSFKTGTHEVKFDKQNKILSINSADVWTGYTGLSGNSISDKTK